MQFRDFLSSLHAAVVIVCCSVHDAAVVMTAAVVIVCCSVRDTAVVIACAVSTPLWHARAAPASTSLPEAADGRDVRAAAAASTLLPDAADGMLVRAMRCATIA